VVVEGRRNCPDIKYLCVCGGGGRSVPKISKAIFVETAWGKRGTGKPISRRRDQLDTKMGSWCNV